MTGLVEAARKAAAREAVHPELTRKEAKRKKTKEEKGSGKKVQAKASNNESTVTVLKGKKKKNSAEGDTKGIEDNLDEQADQVKETPIDCLGKKLLEDMLALMETLEAFCLNVPCLVKGKDGKWVEGALKLTSSQELENLLMVAGSVCKDWSSMNANRSQLLGSWAVSAIHFDFRQLWSSEVFSTNGCNLYPMTNQSIISLAQRIGN